MEHMMRYGDFLRNAIAAAALAALSFAADAQPGKVMRVFSCEVHGRAVYGDTLPKECYGRAWVEKRNGIVVHREDAPPTPEESARRRELARQQEEARKEALKKKRQDEALLERYASLEALVQHRDHEIAGLDKSIGALRAEEEKLSARRKSLDDEQAALGGKPVSPDLRKAIGYADEELARARAAIERKVNERDSLRQRFDADHRQYLEITSSKPAPKKN